MCVDPAFRAARNLHAIPAAPSHQRVNGRAGVHDGDDTVEVDTRS